MFIASPKYIVCVNYINWCHMEPMTVNGLKQSSSKVVMNKVFEGKVAR